MRKKVSISIIGCLVMLLFSTLSLAENNSLKLAEGDCIKCHPSNIREVNERGASHKTEVSCIDCHEEHPPQGKNIIPKCSACHPPDTSSHYALKECKKCHHPHYPKEMDLSKIDNVKPACVSCHPTEGQENRTYPSAHSELDCKKCHSKHGESTACLECHDPHSPEMNYKDCFLCHKPHRPAAIKYDAVVLPALCASCHDETVNAVDERGGAHKSVKCIDCHQQHPPAEKNVIPKCSLCHAPSDKPHYKVENCASCHYPHYPMEMDLSKADSVNSACVSCHPAQDKEMKAHPSEHAGLDCNECHVKHGESPSCMECHEPHTQGMTLNDCLRCHKPHMPLEIIYGEDIDPSFCLSCHKLVGEKMSTVSHTKHHELGCVYCHKNKHKSLLKCKACHGEPHKYDIHVKFPDCRTCHQDPHGLIK